MAAGRHLGFCYRSKMTSKHVTDCPCLPSRQLWWQHLKCWPSCDCTSTGGWVIAFCEKIQNGGVRHSEFVFGNSGLPAKFSYGPEAAQKIWCQSNFYFWRYRDFKIFKIWLKTPIQAPKIYVFAVLTSKCYLSLLRPQKGTSLAGDTPFEPSHVAVRRTLRPGRWVKSTKKGSPEWTVKVLVVAQTPPVNRSSPNFARWFVSRMCSLVLSFRKIFEFQKDRLKNVGAVEGRNFTSHIEKAHHRRAVAQHHINDDSLSQWRRAKFDPPQNGDPEPIAKKFDTVHYVREAIPCAKFRANPSTGGFSANAWNIKEFFLIYTFCS